MIRALLVGHLTWNIPLLITFAIVTLIYLIQLNKLRPLKSYKQIMLFLVGWWLLYLIIGSPLLAISYLSFSFHMIQMSLLYFIIPPLILLGIPRDMYKRLVNHRFIRPLTIRLISPKAALIIFSILFFMYHLPFVLTIITQQALFQQSFLTLLFFLSFFMWWPISSPDPKARLKSQARKKFVFQSGMYIMPACLMFIVSALLEGASNPFLGEMTAHLCLPQDSSIEVLPPPFNTKYDQILAGCFMMGLHKGGLMVTCKLESHMKSFIP